MGGWPGNWSGIWAGGWTGSEGEGGAAYLDAGFAAGAVAAAAFGGEISGGVEAPPQTGGGFRWPTLRLQSQRRPKPRVPVYLDAGFQAQAVASCAATPGSVVVAGFAATVRAGAFVGASIATAPAAAVIGLVKSSGNLRGDVPLTFAEARAEEEWLLLAA